MTTTNVFVANFERGSEVVDLYQYLTKCLSLLHEHKRDGMCKRFCWSARGIDYLNCAPLFQDIDIECDIANVIECTKQIIDEYYGIDAKTLMLKRKNANKYHIYYINVFVDKLMLKFINIRVNNRLKTNIIDTNCAFPRLEGFNKWKWLTQPQRDKHTGKYIDSGKGYYEQDSYYLPVDTSVTLKQVYKKIYIFTRLNWNL